jgi:NADH-quinone oxidoreductase subunit J
MFYVLVAVIAAGSVLAVTSRRMLRAATYLLLVLLATAGLYLLLDYHFLSVVQLSVYAGGILILFIFAILLTSSRGDKTEPHDRRRVVLGIVTGLAGLAVTTFATLKHSLPQGTAPLGDVEIPMKEIGTAMLGTGKFQYLLPFEALSVLLLTCAIGAILIARKR